MASQRACAESRFNGYRGEGCFFRGHKHLHLECLAGSVAGGCLEEGGYVSNVELCWAMSRLQWDRKACRSGGSIFCRGDVLQPSLFFSGSERSRAGGMSGLGGFECSESKVCHAWRESSSS